MTNRQTVAASPESWSPIPFYVASTMFAVAAAFSVASIVADAARLGLLIGETFIAAGWIAGLIALVGLYPGLPDRDRWMTRAGAVFSVIGIIAFVVLGIASLIGFITGASVERGVSVVGVSLIYLFPGIIVAPILAFASFSVATVRTGVYSRTIGILLGVPSFIIVANVATPPTLPGREILSLGIECGLAFVMLTLGYVIKTQSATTDRTESATDTTVS